MKISSQYMPAICSLLQLKLQSVCGDKTISEGLQTMPKLLNLWFCIMTSHMKNKIIWIWQILDSIISSEINRHWTVLNRRQCVIVDTIPDIITRHDMA